MKAIISLFVLMSVLSIGSVATADVLFEERFSGPTVNPSVWRPEILTSCARWCGLNLGQGEGPGTWVAEVDECCRVAAYSPYGSALLSDGLLHLSSTNGEVCPYLVSRRPGQVPVLPESGDSTLRARMRFDHITPWGAGFELDSALEGSYITVAFIPSAYELREFKLQCVGTAFTILVDGQIVYRPVTSSLRPTAVEMGNPVLAYWYPTDWCGFSVDSLQVEMPGPVPTVSCSWDALKAMYR